MINFIRGFLFFLMQKYAREAASVRLSAGQISVGPKKYTKKILAFTVVK